MAIPDPIQELANRLRHLSSSSPLPDFEKNGRALLSGILGKLDLVTRDEFDAQTAVLARTREKLEVLERRIETLEVLLQESGR